MDDLVELMVLKKSGVKIIWKEIKSSNALSKYGTDKRCAAAKVTFLSFCRAEQQFLPKKSKKGN